MIIVFSYYIKLARKYHQREYKDQKFYIQLFLSLIIIISVIATILEIVYSAMAANKAVNIRENNPKLEQTQFYVYDELCIAIVIFDYIKWLVTAIIFLLFKRNQDMFCCFSKVDDMAKITIF